MSNVITITRQFGSMGRHIGMQVAEIMGYKYLDRDILEDTAKKMDISLERLLLLEDKDIIKDTTAWHIRLGSVTE